MCNNLSFVLYLYSLYFRKELMFHFKGSLIRTIHLASYTCLVPLMMFITFSMYVLLEGGVVTPRKVFVCLSLLVVVRLFSVHYAVDGMTRFSQGWVALTRIKVCIIYIYMYVCVY